MAFGFFKKNEVADTIFIGGRIFTQDPDLPWAEAVACKEGRILAVGDYEDLSELKGKNTELIDLCGNVMLPGYIDTCGHPVMNAFKESCLFLMDGDLENTLAQISEYASASSGTDIVFAYGCREEILKDFEAEQARELLDKACADKPVIVLGKSGFHCFVNTIAADMVKAAAEEEEVNTITLPYLLGVLEPIDLNHLPETLTSDIRKYCERGFTSVFDCGAPDFFASIYQNMLVHIYQEDLLKQRFWGSLLFTRNVNPKAVMQMLSQYRTNCAELNGYINFNTLKLIVENTGETLTISEEVLKELCIEAGDKGFDVHIDALGAAAIAEAAEALSTVRASGYRKNAFTLAHEPIAESKELSDTCYQMDIRESVLTLGTTEVGWRCIETAKNIEEAIDLLTINAAIQLGISSEFGSIQKGKHADFVIFDENPFEVKTLDDFKKLQAVRTIISGAVVYDAEEDDLSQWYAVLTQQQY